MLDLIMKKLTETREVKEFRAFEDKTMDCTPKTEHLRGVNMVTSVREYLLTTVHKTLM